MRRSLAGIYCEHRQGLFSLAMSVTRRPDLAEDAVQEAFARLLKSQRTARGDPTAYVYASVRNAAIDMAKRASRPVAAPASIYNGQEADPSANAIDAERRRRVRQAVELLPDDQRQVVVLKVYAGLTFEQIAGVCGEPLSTVSSRYRRALDRLGKAMEESE